MLSSIASHYTISIISPNTKVKNMRIMWTWFIQWNILSGMTRWLYHIPYHRLQCHSLLTASSIFHKTTVQNICFDKFTSSFYIILSHLHFSPQGRAQMMYKAGLKTLQDVAVCEPRTLMGAVRHLSYVSAVQIVNTAKVRWWLYALVFVSEVASLILGDWRMLHILSISISVLLC